ncbi:hypothetical protein DFJ74DRAFT_209920 [Hyaloraphidium curvatum]|nr:hypothetical protein DFJ74DRAFT_209920 [Hyaloraphidium curvatum]
MEPHRLMMALAALLVLLPAAAFLIPAAGPPAPPTVRPRTSDPPLVAPEWRFARYVPSTWEREWTSFVASEEYAKLAREPDKLPVCRRLWRDRDAARAGEMLEFVGRRMPWEMPWNMSQWMKGVVADQRGGEGGDWDPLWTEDAGEHPVMSKLVYSVVDGQGEGTEVGAFIEPLVGHLRHPYHCFSRTRLGLIDTSYLLFDRRTDGALRDVPVPPRPRTALYFDLGATLYASNGAPKESWGTSQGLFPGVYETLGMEISSMAMWEAKEHRPERVFKDVPAELLGGYQYFNVPVARMPVPAAWADADGKEYNAIAALRGRVGHLHRMLGSKPSPGDRRGVSGSPDVYVVFKLDIDTPTVENPLAARLLELLPGGNASRNGQLEVHEFFFEHHSDIYEVIGPEWCKPRENCPTLGDSYALFTAFRERGVRAHAWI